MCACSRTEAEAKAAGLRACKRCRPDLYYRGEDENIALFEGLAARVRGAAGGIRRCLGAGQGRRRQPDQAGRPLSATMPIWRRRMAAARAGAQRRANCLSGKDKVVGDRLWRGL